MKVELRRAPLPWIGAIAWHYWFVVCDETGRHRWEVWQTKNAGGRLCIGHVHCDLKAPDDGVGGGPSCLDSAFGAGGSAAETIDVRTQAVQRQIVIRHI